MMKSVQKITTLVILVIYCLGLVSCRQCKDKFRAVPGHSACLPRSPDYQSGAELSKTDRNNVVELHNIYRGQVTNAKNMQEMVWDDELAMIAQAWAENCVFRHDKERDIPGRFAVGQNMASGYVNWDQAIKGWVDERLKFSYNSDSMDLGDVGHFTQVVWAETSRVGCGKAKCRGVKDFYVCNYGPAGNVGSIKTPYKSGTQGADCPTRRNTRGLCDCKGKVCYNGGELDVDTCTCKCNTRVSFYKPERNCSLECEMAEEDPAVCLEQYKPEGCLKYDNVPFECPNMCRICPWAGVNYIEGSVPVPAGATAQGTPFTLTAILIVGSVLLL